LARYLVLDWDHNQLNIVQATVGRGRLRIQRALSLAESQTPNPAEAEALGKLLRERLKAAGISLAPVLVCLGRDRVILKEIRHPAVAGPEEPAVIRFQVLKELNDSPEEVVIDYTPAGDVEGTREKRALALVMRRELLATYQTLCRAAGLKLAGLCPRPFGSMACLKSFLGTAVPAPEPRDGAVGLLTVSQPWAEFCVARGDNLLFSRSLTTSANLAAEVRRNLAVYAGQAPQQPVRALYLADGADPAALRTSLQETLGIPVHAFDPFGGVDKPELPVANRAAFTGAVGLLYALAERKALPINFLYPKQPQAPRDPNRRRLAFAGALAGAVLLAVVVYCHAQLQSRTRKLDELFDKQTDVERQLAILETDSKRVKAIDEWHQGEIDWLDELYDLTDRFPDINNLRLTQLTADPIARTAKSPYVARMMLKGTMTADHTQVNQLESQLVNDGHFRVEPKVISRNTGAERYKFIQQFMTHLDVEQLPPEKYVRRLSNRTAAAADNSEDDGGAGFWFGNYGGGQQ